MAEPQITVIARYFATALTPDGIDPEAATQSWRRRLRHAREEGAVEPLAELVTSADPEDPTLREHCEALRR